MSQRELSRLEVVQRLELKQIGQIAAAGQLGLTARQTRHLQTAYRTQGACGLVSKRRGKVSNNRLATLYAPTRRQRNRLRPNPAARPQG